MVNRTFLRLSSFIILCTGFVTLLGCYGFLDESDPLGQASGMIADGNNRAAIDILRTYIYNHQDSFEAHMLAGKAFLNLNSSDEKTLYLSRHYFSSAAKLAANEEQRSRAMQAYSDVKLRMGKASASADALVESAERMKTLGEPGQAANTFLQAAQRFIQDENYDDAADACREGMDANPGEETRAKLMHIMARALFLNEDYPECLKVTEAMNAGQAKLGAIQESEIMFLTVATRFLDIRRKRNAYTLGITKKEFEPKEKQDYTDGFVRALNFLREMETQSDADQRLLALRARMSV